MNICFLENTLFQYNANDLYSNKLRGAESVLINLSNALANNGHKVTVINNCKQNEVINNVKWLNINNYNNKGYFDLAFSNNDTRLFDKIEAKKKILISHSLQSIEKFIRKKQLKSYLKHRPKVLLISDYHQQNRSRLLKLFGFIKSGWAVDDIFIKTNIVEKKPENTAIFTSKSDRNLDLLLNIWKELIYPNIKNCKLLVPSSNIDLNHESIVVRERGSQKDLINDLLSSKIYLIPGHKAELFCLAAEEARELCIPIVTLGIGCLSERVEHGYTGFVANNREEFANYTIKLFKDDNLYNEFRKNLLKKRGFNNWNNTAKKIIDLSIK
mgnify:FL=1|tara:strand:+ start:853 stop:1833 length:981 start_codon:yes stop_codon:yes gene_type:complete